MPSVKGLASGLFEDRLHLRAGDRQRRADGDRHQRDRHADIPDDDAQLIAARPPDRTGPSAPLSSE
jgi:hypothetical protein